MIKVGVFYPRRESAKFDMKYYLGSHVPLLKQRLGTACKSIVIDRGLRGGTPNTPADFVLVANLIFEDAQSFRAAFRPHAKEILADMRNFTTIQPRIQISQTISL
jgi:uncharacterized protein (TIGR02118 family)